MSVFICSCLLFIANSLLFLLRFIALYFLSKTTLLREDDFSVSELTKSSYANKVEEKDGSFSFKFRYQICNSKDTQEENEASLSSSMIHKYQFWSEKDVSGILEEPKELEECYNFDGDKDVRFLSAEDIQKTTMEAMAEKKTDEDKVLSVLNMMQLKKQFSEEDKFSSICSEISSVSFSDFDSDTEPLSDGYSVIDLIIDSDWSSSLSNGYFGDCEDDSEIRETLVNKRNKLAEGQHDLLLERSEGEKENDDDSHAEKNGICHAKKNINWETYSNEINSKVEIQSNEKVTRQRHIQFEEKSKNEDASFVKNGSARLDNSEEAGSEPKPETLDREEVGKTEGDSSKNNSRNSLYDSYEQQHTKDNYNTVQKKQELEEEKSEEIFTLDLNEDEFAEIWEHQDLIMQLKTELKKNRVVGLPTILEESESPNAIEDSKSSKTDKKLSHDEPMDEFHRLYKCYEGGMRKLDILNYQKMYATGFLQLRDPLELYKTQKPIFSTIMSYLSQSFLPFSKKKSNCDASEKYIKELRSDLEIVYVGQICLSWEFLRWQYEKLHKLTDSESFVRHHQYNNVAAEFQQFTVTLQRFIENEIFQGPRLENYVKQRCLLRNLLQLPVIKEDCLKDKMEGKEEDVITREMLEGIMEEAMRIFWEFVKAEKYETQRFFKCLVGNQVELQDPTDYEFMVIIQSSLQKKEKKLKNFLKASNCIVKMLKRRQDGSSNQNFFFTQVDLKILSRVLRMQKITGDQLIWCQKKLSKIIFSGREIHREPSFLLFPC